MSADVMERHFRCPFCHKTHAARITRRVPEGDWGERWWVGCLNCENGGASGQAYLRRLAEAVDCRPIDLLQRAEVVLADLLVRSRRKDTRPRPLPPPGSFDRWAAALQASSGPLRYLTGERGISAKVLAERKVGLDVRRGRPVLTFPMYGVVGELVAYKVRRPGRDQMLSVGGKGRAWPLYPWPANAARAPLVACAGELDALCALSHGLDACSVTLGAGTWREGWTSAVRNREVVVCFDNGEQAHARRVRRLLSASGVKARKVSLRSLGLRKANGDLSDYLLGGGDPADLLSLRRRP